MNNEPFFVLEGDRYRPTGMSRGPWSPTSLHARVVIGLLAREIERQCGEADFTPARLTVDLYRLADLSPAEVRVRPVREGGRIKLIDADFFSGETAVARATCQFLRRTEAPAVKVWSPPDWGAPPPDALPRNSGSDLGGMWETRIIAGGFGAPGARRLWMREVRALVAGEALTPFVRAALAVDFVSPFANSGEGGLAYINSDASLYLRRPPKGEWIGFEVVDHGAEAGVAFGQCRLHDEAGAIGLGVTAALAQRRAMPFDGTG